MRRVQAGSVHSCNAFPDHLRFLFSGFRLSGFGFLGHIISPFYVVDFAFQICARSPHASGCSMQCVGGQATITLP